VEYRNRKSKSKTYYRRFRREKKATVEKNSKTNKEASQKFEKHTSYKIYKKRI
jgi:hypothetical protein